MREASLATLRVETLPDTSYEFILIGGILNERVREQKTLLSSIIL